MPFALLAALGGGLLTAILNVAGLRVGATPAELVLWDAVGVLFARLFALGPLVLALPLLLAAIELAAGSGGTAGAAGAGDPLTLAFPGDHRLALDVLVFAAAYATWAHDFALRWRVVWVAFGVVCSWSPCCATARSPPHPARPGAAGPQRRPAAAPAARRVEPITRADPGSAQACRPDAARAPVEQAP